jgi:glutamate-1-semialdehyde 2,1-aminomutase
VTEIDRGRLCELLDRERAAFRERHPGSVAAYAAADHLFGRVPMTWMNKAAGLTPLYLAAAQGAHVRDVDDHDFADFCLGDTGAMAGHSPAPTVHAVARRFAELGGATAMMPTADAEWVGAELSRRFGLPQWSFTLTATDANRWILRLARAFTGRPRVLVNSYCYHGSVDESLIVVGSDGEGRSRPGNVGAPYDVTATSRVVEFNDLPGLERALAHHDVAAVLMEPALTNIGIVLPEPGYLAGVRALTEAAGSLLIFDETHTFSAGPGGMTAESKVAPDIVTIGKALGGGIPIGGYGLTDALANGLLARHDLDLIDMGGVGGTLAGNALSMAAARATLAEVLTDDAFARMAALSSRLTMHTRATLEAHALPWTVTQLGARAEYRYSAVAPRTGTESAAAADDQLDDFFHVFLANRGVLLTPFHNMALMCPATSEADVDLHRDVFDDAVRDLVG